ncbi:MAG TPA: ABC transporter permease [Micromonosporaceae bacterium]|nr:ABC transporter permease [Micromonosporaceae bacterium]
MWSVLTHAMHRRRFALAWWALGVAGMCGLLAAAYPTVRDNHELDNTFANLSPGIQTLLGLSNNNLLSSPTGYLDSQFYANIWPLIVLVFTIGFAAWTIAGDEQAGTLELLVANPISRVRIALARYTALLALTASLVIVCVVALSALAPSTGLNHGLPAARLAAATVAAALCALVFASVAFAVGAVTGSRPAALATSAGLAIAGYVLEGLAAQVAALRDTRWINPWHWLLVTDPLRHGLTTQAWLPAAGACTVLVLVALPPLARRDLR